MRNLNGSDKSIKEFLDPLIADDISQGRYYYYILIIINNIMNI